MNDMNVVPLILELKRYRVSLNFQGDKLHARLPKEGVPAELKNALVANKDTIKAYLAKVQAGTAAEQHTDAIRAIPSMLHAGLPAPLAASAERSAPAAYPQQRLWVLDQLQGGSIEYNMTNALLLEGDLDITACRQSLDAIVARHQVLRTVLCEVEGQLLQVVKQQQQADFTISKLPTPQNSEDEEEQVREQILAETKRAFDLAQDVLLRARLTPLSAGRYLLLLSVHHIATDGWSMGRLLEEFLYHYRRFCRDDKPHEGQHETYTLPPLSLQYADYAHWQQQQISGERLRAGLDYWRQQLVGLPVLHNLPVDQVRPPQLSYQGGIHRQRVDARLHRRLRHLAGKHNATLFMLLQASFALLLCRYSGERDIAIGTAVANRPRPELAPLIGFFVNSLVLRHDVDLKLGFDDFLARTRTLIQQAFVHQDIPFELLVDELKPERSLSHHPLFQIMLILHNQPLGELALPGLKVAQVEQSQVLAKFDITLNIFPQADDSLLLEWEYAAELFNGNTIATLAEGLGILLVAIVEQPHTQLHALKLLSTAALQQQLFTWNQAAPQLSNTVTLLDHIATQCQRQPDAPALIDTHCTLNYATMWAQINALASHLIAAGLQRGDIVGICMRRGVDMVLAILAVLRAGGAYVPLDPNYPAARTTYILDDAGIRLCLSERILCGRVKLDCTQILYLDEATTQATPSDLAEKQELPTVQDLAYVIYTSGSTGQPKGVMIEHRALANFFLAMQTEQLLNGGRWLATTSLSFDISILELLCPLAVGASIVVAADGDNEQRLEQLATAFASGDISHFQCTPSFASLLLEHPPAAMALKHLSHMLVGGEVLPLDLAQALHQQLGNARLYNMYGPTETTIWSTCTRIEAGCDGISLGKPIANTQLYVLDSQHKPILSGAVGELYIGGGGLARGYLGRAALTGERFIPSPPSLALSDSQHENSTSIAQRLYRTGDLVRWLPAGELKFIGRADDQVKIRGFRIELGEIEVQTRQCDGITEAVSIVDDNTQPPRLLLYIVAQTAEADQDDELENRLRRHLQEQLPGHMLPARIIPLAAMPLTPNGKIDRKALPKVDIETSGNSPYCAPQTPQQTALCAIWQQVLDLDKVGIHDNFFAIGGDSIRALRACKQAQQQGLAINVTQLFTRQTIHGLSALLPATSTTSGTPAWESAWQQHCGPLSATQRQLFARPAEALSGCCHARILRFKQSWHYRDILTALKQASDNCGALRARLVWYQGQWQIDFSPLNDTQWATLLTESTQEEITQADDNFTVSNFGALEPATQLSGDYLRLRKQLSITTSSGDSIADSTPLWRTLWLPGTTPRLLIVAHALIANNTLWRALEQSFHTGPGDIVEQPRPEKLYPASAMQAGMLYHSLLDAGEYLMQVEFTLQGDLNNQAFAQAWQQVVDEQDILRTAFIGDPTALCQWVHPSAALAVDFHDISQHNSATQEARYSDYRQRDKARGFDPQHPPLMRLAVFHCGPCHRVLWSHHHMLLDGWSFPLIYRRMMQVYLSLLGDKELAARLGNVADNTSRYEDHIMDMLSRDQLAASEFWRQQLAGSTRGNYLPRSPKRQVHPSNKSQAQDETANIAQDSVVIELSATASARLDRISRQQQVTLNLLVQLAWVHLLGLYSHSERVCFGTTVAGRDGDIDGLDTMIGLFINTIPVTTTWHEPKGGNGGDGEPIDSALHRLWNGFRAALPHTHLPLAQIHELSGLDKNTPLFDSLLVFENYPLDAGLDTQAALAASRNVFTLGEAALLGKSNYPLTLAVNIGERLHIEAKYRPEDFIRHDVERLMGYFEQILRYIGTGLLPTAAALMRMSKAPLKHHADHKPRPDLRTATLFHQRFEDSVQDHPERLALISGDTRLSFAQLNQQANRLAHCLLRHGMGADPLVAVCTKRGAAFVIAILGIMKAGGAYLPIEPDTPPARLGAILQDSQAAWLLCRDDETIQLQAIIDDANAPTRILPSLDRLIHGAGEWHKHAAYNPDIAVKAEQLAYVIYTSGSTGKPKGVMVEHGSLGGLLYNLSAADGPLASVLSSSDQPSTWGCLASFAFDSSIKGLCALAAGATLHVLATSDKYHPDTLHRRLKASDISLMDATPALVSLWLDELPGADLPHLVIGGDAITPDLWQRLCRWQEQHGKQAINAYGPTECTVNVSFATIRGALPTIGHALHGVDVALLSASQQPCLPGAVGELWVSGYGIARGYLNAAELTRERFAPLNLERKTTQQPATAAATPPRYYRTGDMLTQDDDGRLYFVGRHDHQVSIRGFRIELAEIRQALLACDGVAQAEVITREHDGELRLLAYVVPINNTRLAADPQLAQQRLYQQLRATLPHYMLPATVMPLSALPLTPQGKIDHNALPTVDLNNSPDNPYVAPRSTAEHKLCALIGDILKLPKVGANDDFFTLGGDSMRVIALVKNARDVGLQLSAKDVIEHRVVTAMAALCEADDHHSRESLPPPLHLIPHCDSPAEGDYQNSYPLTAMQRFMVRHYRAEENGVNACYHVQHLIDIRHHTVDNKALQVAWNYLQTCHPILRCELFYDERQQLFQGVRHGTPIAINTLQAAAAVSSKDFCHRVLESDRQQAFSHRAPLLRLYLLLLGPRHSALIFSCHHAIMDGWSFTTLLNQLLQHYHGLTDNPTDNYMKPEGEAEVVVPATADNPLPQHLALELETEQGTDAYLNWCELLADYEPMTPLPRLVSESGGRPSITPSLEKIVDNTLNQALNAYARQQGIHVKSLFLLAYQHALAKLTGDRGVTVDMVCAARSSRLSDPMGAVGLMWNLLPLYLYLQPHDKDNLRQLTAVLNKTEQTAAYPLYPDNAQTIVAALGHRQKRDSLPTLSDYAFNYTHFHHLNRAAATASEQQPMALDNTCICDRFHHALKLFISADADMLNVQLVLDYDPRQLGHADASEVLNNLIKHLKNLLEPLPMASVALAGEQR